MPKYKITVDRENCIGCGNCQALCRKTFVVDPKDSKSRVIKPIISKITCEKEAEISCPVNIIKIKEIK